MGLHIVLFEPEIPQNTGNIARTCAALNAQLHLVHPLGFLLSEKHIRRAGLDYWHLLTIHQYPSIDSFLLEHEKDELWFFTTKGEKAYTEAVYSATTYLIFGKESAGIQQAILSRYRSNCLRIPIRNEARSLNLANAVAVGAFEYERQQNFQQLRI